MRYSQTIFEMVTWPFRWWIKFSSEVSAFLFVHPPLAVWISNTELTWSRFKCEQVCSYPPVGWMLYQLPLPNFGEAHSAYYTLNVVKRCPQFWGYLCEWIIFSVKRCPQSWGYLFGSCSLLSIGLAVVILTIPILVNYESFVVKRRCNKFYSIFCAYLAVRSCTKSISLNRCKPCCNWYRWHFLQVPCKAKNYLVRFKIQPRFSMT